MDGGTLPAGKGGLPARPHMNGKNCRAVAGQNKSYTLKCFSFRKAILKKIAIYCPQGSGTLRQPLTILHYLALSCIILHYLALSCIIWHYHALSCTILHYLALSCTILHYLAPSCTILQYPALSCTILHYLALSCTILHLLALSCSDALLYQ